MASLRESLKGLCAVVALAAGAAALAVGLGKLELESRLNQPFRAQIPLIGLKKGEMEDLRAGLASEADFARHSVERSDAALGLLFELVSTGPETGYIQVRSRRHVREPALEFIVELDTPGGRRLRTYSVLLETN